MQKVEYIPNQLFLPATSPLGFCFQFSLEAAFAAAVAASAAAAAPSGQKRLGQPVIAFCLFLLPCFTTATYILLLSLLLLLYVFSLLPGCLSGFSFFLSFQVSFLCMYLGLGFMTDF